MLTQGEAKTLLLTRLQARFEFRVLAIAEERTIERPFGWVFFLAETPPTASQISTKSSLGPIIVNKNVEQVIASSIAYPPDRFISIYEKLLAKSRRSAAAWCLTLSMPPPLSPSDRGDNRIAKKAKQAGFYEIR
jgi:hypothetical protein